MSELKKDENILRYKVRRLLEISQDLGNPNDSSMTLDPDQDQEVKDHHRETQSSQSPPRVADFNYVWTADGDS